MAYTSKNLAEDISNRTNLTKAQAKEAIEGFQAALTDVLSTEGNTLTMHGFGTFKCVPKGDREVRNPRTGELSYKEKYLNIKFSTSKKMVASINPAQ